MSTTTGLQAIAYPSVRRQKADRDLVAAESLLNAAQHNVHLLDYDMRRHQKEIADAIRDAAPAQPKLMTNPDALLRGTGAGHYIVYTAGSETDPLQPPHSDEAIAAAKDAIAQAGTKVKNARRRVKQYAGELRDVRQDCEAAGTFAYWRNPPKGSYRGDPIPLELWASWPSWKRRSMTSGGGSVEVLPEAFRAVD